MSGKFDNSDISMRLPNNNYFAMATNQIAFFDRVMVTLFSGLISGLVLMSLNNEVSPWVGALFLIALVMFVFGIGHTLLHIVFHNKILMLLEALVNGTKYVPNLIEYEEPTNRAFIRHQQYAQRAFSGQFMYLFIGFLFAAAAVMLHLWSYSYRAGVILAILFAVAIGGGIAFRVWSRRTSK